MRQLIRSCHCRSAEYISNRAGASPVDPCDFHIDMKETLVAVDWPRLIEATDPTLRQDESLLAVSLRIACDCLMSPQASLEMMPRAISGGENFISDPLQSGWNPGQGRDRFMAQRPNQKQNKVGRRLLRSCYFRMTCVCVCV